MATTNKFEELAGLAFENGIRLHLDAAKSYLDNSFATAYQLAITASEEIGKAILIEDYVWNSWVNGWNDKNERDYLLNIFSNHKTKQRVFAVHANEFLRRNAVVNASALIKPLVAGVGEIDKQNSTFVGLTRTKTGKTDLNGKIVLPRLFAQPPKAKKQITLNSDFLIVYTSGFLRGIYGTDCYSIAHLMDKDTLEVLSTNWEIRGKLASRILKEHSKHKMLKDPLAEWK